MEFRLTYQGKLPAAGSGRSGRRVDEKHEIRRRLHVQLRNLWLGHPFIAQYSQQAIYKTFPNPTMTRPDSPRYLTIFAPNSSVVDKVSSRYSRFGYRFVPLIGSAFGPGTETLCALDILFLRRAARGGLVNSGGDIDNRLKVLFDALRVPKSAAEIPTGGPARGENPFFCLLEDDSLITEVKVVTDQLLTDAGSGDSSNDVHLVIHVRTIAIGSRFADVGAQQRS